MKKNIFSFLVLVFVTYTAVFSQADSLSPKRFLGVSAGPTLVLSPDSISDYWKAGYNLGLVFGEKISRWGSVSIQLDYNTIFFNKEKYLDQYVNKYQGSNSDSIRRFANDTLPEKASMKILQVSLGIMIHPFTCKKLTPYVNLGININFPLKDILLHSGKNGNITYVDNTTDAGAGILAALGTDYEWRNDLHFFTEIKSNWALEKLFGNQEQKMQWNILNLKLGIKKRF